MENNIRNLELNPLLDQWKNCRSQLWQFNVGHSILFIRLYRDESVASLFLKCDATYQISCLSLWKNAHLQIMETNKTDGQGRYRVYDRNSDNFIRCGILTADICDFDKWVSFT